MNSTLARVRSRPGVLNGLEQVLVVLCGQGELSLGDRVTSFEGPCTLIAPANIPHQIVNAGPDPIEAVAALPVGSGITSPEGEQLILPWWS